MGGLFVVIEDEHPPVEYVSYNGLGRNPMIFGVPYIAGGAIFSISLIGGMLLANFIHPYFWLLSLISIPLIFFIKVICETDDKAVDILLLEIKWSILRLVNYQPYKGLMTITPVTYGRRFIDVKRYFETIPG